MEEKDDKEAIQVVCPMCFEMLSRSCGHCSYSYCQSCFRTTCPNCKFEQQPRADESVQQLLMDPEENPANKSAEIWNVDDTSELEGPTEKKPRLQELEISVKTNQNCDQHSDHPMELFCLTCETRVCAKCLIAGREHKRHTIDSLSEVYKEKLAVTKAKMKEIDAYIKEIAKTNEAKKLIAQQVEEIEHQMLQRLDNLFQVAQQELLTISKAHKQMLVRNSRLPIRKSRLLDHVNAKIEAMPQGHFVVHQAALHEQLDEIMNRPLQYYQAARRDYYDIKCDLLPRIRLLTTSVKMFDSDDVRDALWVPRIPISDHNGNKWEIIFSKDEVLSVQVHSKECSQIGHFLAVIVLLNKDPLKVFQVQVPITCPVPSSGIAPVEIFELVRLQSEGYVCPQGMLQLRCGIGPADPITERVFYKAYVERQSNEISSLKKTIRRMNQFVVGTFLVTDLQLHVHSPVEQCYLSQKICDIELTEWRLNVNIGPTNGFIGAFINKCGGPSGKYEYFIELLHATSPDQNRKICSVHQFEQALHGQTKFLPRNKIDGFLKNGNLRFRYGVRTVSEAE